MEIITIQIETRNGQPSVAFQSSSGVTPDMGQAACSLVADAFREQLIEAEIERRMAERETT